jgi:hypothetical protein
MFKKRAKTNSAQKGLRKPAVPVSTSTKGAGSDSSSEDEGSDGEPMARTSGVLAGRKRKRAGGVIQASSTKLHLAKEELGLGFEGSGGSGVVLDPISQATAVSAEFTESELLGRPKSNVLVDASASDNVYRGQAGYRSFVPKREQATTKYNPLGPQKAASNIRMTTYTDYAPGVFLLPMIQEHG